MTSGMSAFERRYLSLIRDIVEESCVNGCMILKAYGYGIWEIIREEMDIRLRNFGYMNMNFPSLIPYSKLKLQKEHFESFKREVLVCDTAGESAIPERLVIRPTSESVIYPAFSKWIRSSADLPLLVNQWCNIVRWEVLKPNFPLIRDNEFLWHECHACYSSQEECEKHVDAIYGEYIDFITGYLAIPIFKGIKPQRRKFPGARTTYALEAMMGNCKSLQMATAHDLGQEFSRAYGIKAGNGYVWQGCAGLTTRLIGAIVMVHSDKFGLIIPPRVAPIQAAMKKRGLSGDLGIRVSDDTELWISDLWIKKGIPLLIKDETIIIRDTMEEIKIEHNLSDQVRLLLSEMQERMFKKADSFAKEHTIGTEDWSEFKDHLSSLNGFARSPWCGNTACSANIRNESMGSLRLLERIESKAVCIRCKEPAKYIGVFGQSY